MFTSTQATARYALRHNIGEIKEELDKLEEKLEIDYQISKDIKEKVHSVEPFITVRMRDDVMLLRCLTPVCHI